MRQRPMVVALLALSMVSAGCLGLFDDEDANQTTQGPPPKRIRDDGIAAGMNARVKTATGG